MCTLHVYMYTCIAMCTLHVYMYTCIAVCTSHVYMYTCIAMSTLHVYMYVYMIYLALYSHSMHAKHMFDISQIRVGNAIDRFTCISYMFHT